MTERTWGRRGARKLFVFGSNTKGLHGGGAAREARLRHGAVPGQGFGLQGDSFAIPTCALPTGMPDCGIPLSEVAQAVAAFLAEARERPDLDFQVTQVGCGLAGWAGAEMAPLFAGAPTNCFFDEAWRPWLGDGALYWGTY